MDVLSAWAICHCWVEKRVYLKDETTNLFLVPVPIILSHSDCIYMELGVSWIDAAFQSLGRWLKEGISLGIHSMVLKTLFRFSKTVTRP